MAGGHTLNIKQGPGSRNRCHPSRIRPGQLFFPRSGSRRLRFVIKRLDGELVRVVREDSSEASVSLDRLLEKDRDGDGAHYRFHGWRRLPRGYRTELTVLRVSEDSGRCSVLLPEWDPGTEVELDLGVLPDAMRGPGTRGSCRADLTAESAAALAVHDFSPAKPRGLSREAIGPHPEILGEGQEYRRRSDEKKFRLLEVDHGSTTVSAWSGARVVRLYVARLLATRPDGAGRHYCYLGGGLRATRRRRARHSAGQSR